VVHWEGRWVPKNPDQKQQHSVSFSLSSSQPYQQGKFLISDALCALEAFSSQQECLLCLLFILKCPPRGATVRETRRWKEDWWCPDLAREFALCGSDILTVVAAALASSGCPKPFTVYLGTGSLTDTMAKIPFYKSSLYLSAWMHFVFLGKLFSLKNTFLSLSLKGFPDQIFTQRICLRCGIPCQPNPLPPGPADADLIHIHLPSWSQFSSPRI
jgi:hypothetical protein